ncbi:MAG: PDZ domain-containing protein [Gemmatimonadaceae bacterium]
MRQLLNRPNFFRWTAVAGGALMAAAAPARAQRDSVVLRTTGVEAEVVKVARELIEKKRMQIALMRMLNDLSSQLQDPSSDAERDKMEQEVRTVRLRLNLTGIEGTELRRKLSSLCNVDHQPNGWLGVNLQGDVEVKKGTDGELSSRYLDFPTVVSVEPASPAAKAGLESGDRLMMLDGRDMRAADVDISAMLQPGARLAIRVRRGLEGKSLLVLIERRPDSFQPPCQWMDQAIAEALREAPNEGAFIVPMPPDAPRTRLPSTPVTPPSAVRPPNQPAWGSLVYSYNSSGTGTVAGAEVAALNQDLGETFGVERGLLILKVLPGTPAEQSGLRGGDVILSANGVAITEPVALQRAIRNARSRALKLSIVRRKKPLTIALQW